MRASTSGLQCLVLYSLSHSSAAPARQMSPNVTHKVLRLPPASIHRLIDSKVHLLYMLTTKIVGDTRTKVRGPALSKMKDLGLSAFS